MKIIRVDFQTGKRIKDAPIKKAPTTQTKQFYHVSYKVSPNCSNPYSYGCICVKCGACGRKFNNGCLIT